MNGQMGMFDDDGDEQEPEAEPEFKFQDVNGSKPPTGDELRDKALAQVERAADDAWKEAAHEAGLRVAGRMYELTTDDVWEEMRGTEASTHENRAMGAVMQRLRREGVIAPTDRHRKSVRPECHSNPKRVWRRA